MRGNVNFLETGVRAVRAKKVLLFATLVLLVPPQILQMTVTFAARYAKELSLKSCKEKR